MKFKLDENFGKRTQQLFKASGHEVQTVREQGLQGSPDLTLFNHCLREQRCLVTLDLDFSDVTRFPPQQTAGIAVIRIPQNPSLPLWRAWFNNYHENDPPSDKKAAPLESRGVLYTSLL